MKNPIVVPLLILAGLAFALTAGAQELTLDDKDLQTFEESGAGSESLPAAELKARRLEQDAVSARYDRLIDQLEQDLRKVRIEVRDLPAQAEDRRSRLKSLEDAEDRLRREAFQRVINAYPYPIYEDFDAAIEEALDRRETRESLKAEIAEIEANIDRLESKRRELIHDLNQTISLKQEAMEDLRQHQNAGRNADRKEDDTDTSSPEEISPKTIPSAIKENR